ncbi:hypothetical protein ACE193_15250 [Bernardetia sp. OM2101]|uniref:hypothetical protein n=1 Tax=Bernardetia sp. OM2101 TaxID=3344876 RepID=UPI0035CFE1C2
MISNSRNIAQTTQFDRFFPKSTGKDTVIIKMADVDDTLDLMQKVIVETLDDTKLIVELLKKDSIKATSEAIWSFVYKHINYKEDEQGIEQVRRPSRTWRDRKTGVDCDCYLVFICSILSNLGIESIIRITDNYGNGWNHVYPVAIDENGKEIVIDCVLHEFNKEHSYKRKKDTRMELARLDGLNGGDCGCGCSGNCEQTNRAIVEQQTTYLSGLFSNWNNPLDWVKEKADDFGDTKVGGAIKDGVQAVKSVVASPLRNGLLLYMKGNLFKAAERLRWGWLTEEEAAKYGIPSDKYQKIGTLVNKVAQIYLKAGGSRSALRSAVFNGKGNRSPKLAEPTNLQSPIGGLGNLQPYKIEYYQPSSNEGIARQGNQEVSIAAQRNSALQSILAQTRSTCQPQQIEAIEGLFGLQGLGVVDPATVSLIAVATGAMTAVVAALDKMGIIHSSQADGSNESDSTGDAQLDAQQREQQEAMMRAMQEIDAEIDAIDNQNQNPSSPIEWVKQNPLPSAGVVAVVLIGGYMLLKPKDKPKPTPKSQLTGTRKRKSTPRKKTTSRKKPNEELQFLGI